jgi:hypothetical protein
MAAALLCGCGFGLRRFRAAVRLHLCQQFIAVDASEAVNADAPNLALGNPSINGADMAAKFLGYALTGQVDGQVVLHAFIACSLLGWGGSGGIG